jgi:hypothetical protein
MLPQNAIFPLYFQIKILSLECRWPPFFLFLFGRAYYKEVFFKLEGQVSLYRSPDINKSS